MLDWDDEELANILWGEVPEAVVPYPEGNEGSQSAAPLKELNEELSSHKLEIKRAPDKAGSREWDNDTDSIFNSSTEKSLSRSSTEPWNNPIISTADKKDHESSGTNLAGSAGTTQNLLSSGDGAAQSVKNSETSQSQLEEQENSDFVDYSWTDIGSFDVLDKLFSNDDPIFCNAGLGSVDELWSASKDAGYSLENHFMSVESLTSLPGSNETVYEQNKVRTEYTDNSNQPISDHGIKMDCKSYDRSDADVPTDGAACNEGNGKLKLKETRFDRTEKDTVLGSSNSSKSTLNKLSNKVNKQKKMKTRKAADQRIKGKSLLSPYGSQYHPGNQFQQFGKQEATSMVHSYPFSEPSQLRHSAVHPGSNQFSVPSDNIYGQYTGMPMLPQLHCGVGSLQHKNPGYDVSHGSSLLKTSHAPLKPLFMSPQEKIDKLRRRQQMQAMLAIKKQQQELSYQASGLDIDHSVSKKHFCEIQIETTNVTENDNEETHIIPPHFDPSCSSEKKISNEVPRAVNEFPIENSALSQLQDIISKLDSRVRLCIRDSLFRLATSAAQRHYPSATVSADSDARDEDHMLGKNQIGSHNRSGIMVDAETETNPIDRTVAHLLFHRPFDVIAKHSETLNSSVSTQPLPESKTDSLVGLPTVQSESEDSTELKESLSHKESEISLPETKPQLGTEFLESSCMDVSENASNHETCSEKLSTDNFLNKHS
ncbi:unnamed protein product [Rhodiola kirilowii]